MDMTILPGAEALLAAVSAQARSEETARHAAHASALRFAASGAFACGCECGEGTSYDAFETRADDAARWLVAHRASHETHRETVVLNGDGTPIPAHLVAIACIGMLGASEAVGCVPGAGDSCGADGE